MSFATSQERGRLSAAILAILALPAFAAVAQTDDAVGAQTAPSARVHLATLGDAGHLDRFIVKFREGSAAHANPALLERTLDAAAARAVPLVAAQGGKAQAFGVRHLRRLAVGADVVRVDRRLDRRAAEILMREIAADPDVLYVEADRLLKAKLEPNDTRYGEQWNYFDPTGGANLPAAWDVTTGGGSVVAVLDTGITDHSDLNANVIAGYDFIDDPAVANDGDGRDADPHDPGDAYGGYPSSWHGTHVAGTVAAVTNNGSGVAGVAFGAQIQPVRVLGAGGGYTSDIADAIVWASGGSVSGVPDNATPAEAINLSLGGGGACDSTTQSAIDGAVSRGTTVVVAAGNESQDVANSSPANCNGVIAVAATTQSGDIASFSNYGAGIDVSAPGAGILSTLNTGSDAPGEETYASYSGTSMAAPHVAGLVALVQSVQTRTPAEVEQWLKDTARPLPGSCPNGCGAGIIDAAAAVGGAPPPPGDVLENDVPVTNQSGGAGAELRWTLEVPAGATSLTVTTAGGGGDADLYVQAGSAPTLTSYDCRPYLYGNDETCTFDAPAAGTWHVLVHGYTAFSGVTVTANW